MDFNSTKSLGYYYSNFLNYSCVCPKRRTLLNEKYIFFSPETGCLSDKNSVLLRMAFRYSFGISVSRL